MERYIEYKRHRAMVTKMTQRQRRDDWNKFVKTLVRDITGTQRRGFKIFKHLQLHERDKLKIEPIPKREWKEYYGKLWNEQDSKGEEGTKEERRSEGTDDNRDIMTMEELNEVLKHAKNRKRCGLDNLPMELWKFGGNELRIQLLELFNKTNNKQKPNATRMGDRNSEKHTQKRNKKQT